MTDMADVLFPKSITSVFVVMALPNGDGSGDAALIGVFVDLMQAEAAVGRAHLDQDYYGQPLKITELKLNERSEVQP